MGHKVTSSDRGFSLLEMVIVVAVIAVMSITAVFSVGRTGEASQSDARRFSAAYAHLREAAILSRQSRAMFLSPDGWQVLKPSDGGSAQWVLVGTAQKFRGQARFQGKTNAFGQGGATPTPDLIFLPDGQVTQFEASFISAKSVTRCSGSGWEGMTCAGG